LPPIAAIHQPSIFASIPGADQSAPRCSSVETNVEANKTGHLKGTLDWAYHGRLLYADLGGAPGNVDASARAQSSSTERIGNGDGFAEDSTLF
jgi:hypothetical protein